MMLLIVTFFVAIINFSLIHFLFGWLWLLVFGLRQVAILTAKFRKDFGNILPWRDVGMWDDFSKNHRGTSPLTILFDEDISGEKFQTLFIKHVLNATVGENQLKFPELQQYQCSWLGFLFWRNDKHFNINNHIREVFADKHPAKWNRLDEVNQENAYKPYHPGASPWEVIVIRNFKNSAEPVQTGKKQTLIFIRLHHSMADGFAIISLFVNYLCQTANTSCKPGVLAKPAKNSIVDGLLTILQFPGACFRLQMIILQNLWFKRNLQKHQGTGNLTTKLSATLSLKEAKMLAKKHNVRLSAVTMSLIAENLSKLLKPKPSHFYASYAMPLPSHPGTLTNHVQLGTIPIPVGSMDSILDRMQKLNDAFLNLKDDPVPKVMNYFGYLCGSLFPSWTKFLLEMGSYTPVAITNFSFGTSFKLEDAECRTFVAFPAPYEVVTDSLIAIEGYDDHIYIACAADDRFLTPDEVSKFVIGVKNDFDELVSNSKI